MDSRKRGHKHFDEDNFEQEDTTSIRSTKKAKEQVQYGNSQDSIGDIRATQTPLRLFVDSQGDPSPESKRKKKHKKNRSSSIMSENLLEGDASSLSVDTESVKVSEEEKKTKSIERENNIIASLVRVGVDHFALPLTEHKQSHDSQNYENVLDGSACQSTSKLHKSTKQKACELEVIGTVRSINTGNDVEGISSYTDSFKSRHKKKKLEVIGTVRSIKTGNDVEGITSYTDSFKSRHKKKKRKSLKELEERNSFESVSISPSGAMGSRKRGHKHFDEDNFEQEDTNGTSNTKTTKDQVQHGGSQESIGDIHATQTPLRLFVDSQGDASPESKRKKKHKKNRSSSIMPENLLDRDASLLSVDIESVDASEEERQPAKSKQKKKSIDTENNFVTSLVRVGVEHFALPLTENKQSHDSPTNENVLDGSACQSTSKLHKPKKLKVIGHVRSINTENDVGDISSYTDRIKSKHKKKRQKSREREKSNSFESVSITNEALNATAIDSSVKEGDSKHTNKKKRKSSKHIGDTKEVADSATNEYSPDAPVAGSPEQSPTNITGAEMGTPKVNKKKAKKKNQCQIEPGQTDEVIRKRQPKNGATPVIAQDDNDRCTSNRKKRKRRNESSEYTTHTSDQDLFSSSPDCSFETSNKARPTGKASSLPEQSCDDEGSESEDINEMKQLAADLVNAPCSVLADELHSRSLVNSKKLHQILLQQGAAVGKGRWTKREDEQLKKNFETYKQKYPSYDALDLIDMRDISGKEKKAITEIKKSTNFWVTTGADIARPVSSIKDRLRATFIYASADITGTWSTKDDAKLLNLHAVHGNKWAKIATSIGRHQKQVQGRYYTLIGKTNKEEKWSKEDNKKLMEVIDTVVKEHGTHAWSSVCLHFPNRTNRECRHQWYQLRYQAFGRKEKLQLIQSIIDQKVDDPALINWDTVALDFNGIFNQFSEGCKKK